MVPEPRANRALKGTHGGGESDFVELGDHGALGEFPEAPTFCLTRAFRVRLRFLRETVHESARGTLHEAVLYLVRLRFGVD